MMVDNNGTLSSPQTVAWVDGGIELVDQTRIPFEITMVKCTNVANLVDCIKRLVVRGAPAIGVAGAYGVALAALHHNPLTDADAYLSDVANLRSARPTAVNLAKMVDRVASIATSYESALAEAHNVRLEELNASRAMGDLGADLLLDLCGRKQLRVMTICNTGGLATVERGTALAVIQTLYERGFLEEAIPLETRPLLQGGRLTTWELSRMGAPFRLIVDSAAAGLVSRGFVDVIVAGADRISRNGDTANKVGTFSLALAANYAGIPFIIVAPESTVDIDTPNGDAIEIEDRDGGEVSQFGDFRVCPDGTPSINPAFDVTPVGLIDALVTDKRVVRFRLGEKLVDQ